MATDTQAGQLISQLLAPWEELRVQDQTLWAEKLCADCPELVEELQRRIRALRDMDRALGLAAPSATKDAPTQRGPAQPDTEPAPSPTAGEAARYRPLHF